MADVKLFDSMNSLLDVLAEAIKPEEFMDLLEDMRDLELGNRIVMQVNTDAGHRLRIKRLLKSCQKYDGGLDLLWQALSVNICRSRKLWPRLEQAFLAYQDERHNSRQPSEAALGDSVSEVLKAAPPVPEKLHAMTTATPSSPTTSQSVYISYAWGDSSPEGQRRGRLVDQLCEAITVAGITVLIDREQVKSGDRISAFMESITRGDVVIIILSHKYLESEYCVFELNGIWKQASQEPDRFLQRVIPLTLPDANLKATEDLFIKSQYWIQRWKMLREQVIQNVDATGIELFAKFKNIQQFAHHLGDILALLNDKCEPRDFDRQAQEGFREVIDQIRAVRKI